MSYTFEDNVLTVEQPDGDQFIFIIDPSDPEPVYDRNNFLVGYTTLEEHKLLAADFQDVTKLERFVSLIEQNPTTAYKVYLATR